MPTECSRDLYGYEAVEGRRVVAAFDGGEVTSDAGALLLGATDRAIGWSTAICSLLHGSPRRQAQVEHGFARWCCSGCSARPGLRGHRTTTTSCATIRCWRRSPAS